jgi:hypothetical protein
MSTSAFRPSFCFSFIALLLSTAENQLPVGSISFKRSRINELILHSNSLITFLMTKEILRIWSCFSLNFENITEID